MGILLAIVAAFMTVIITPFGIIYECITLMRFSTISEYFFNIAVSIDQMGNVTCQGLLNDTLRKKEGFRFGDPDETISSVLGRNQQAGTLTFLGKIVAGTLNRIQPDHCIKSIGH